MNLFPNKKRLDNFYNDFLDSSIFKDFFTK